MKRTATLVLVLAMGLVTGLYSLAENGEASGIMEHPSSRLVDLGALSITGESIATVGQETIYTVRLRNNGSGVQDDYQVKLMGPDDTVLASVAGPAINGQHILDVAIPWTPDAAGILSVYGEVELEGDEVDQNNRTASIELQIMPEGTQAVTVGEGSLLDRFPISFNFFSSLYQTLYLADELGFESGTITSMSIYNQFFEAVNNANIQIYLGSTDQANLSAGFVPASQLSLVFDGNNIEFPAGENIIHISFQTPYVHTGGNLVVMFFRPRDTTALYNPMNYFKCQVGGTNRARYAHTDIYIYDPFNPPEGSCTNRFPQATFFYGPQLLGNDLEATTITGDRTPTVGQEANYTVTIRNNGSAAQTSYAVKLMDSNEVELASVAGPEINSLQTLEVVIPWTPTTAGAISVYGKVDLAGDEMTENNQTPPIGVGVQHEGNQAVTVGVGTEPARIPIDFVHSSSLYQTLYYPGELGVSNVTITSLAFYSDFSLAVSNSPTQIWLGGTLAQDLSDGCIPAGELSLVFEGDIDIQTGQNPVVIYLQTPYYYAGGNLVMMVYRPLDLHYHSHTNHFRCQTGGANRAQNVHSEGTANVPYDPPFGLPTEYFPQTTFFYASDAIQNDLSALTIAGTDSPTVGIAATYLVHIRNNGSATQNNYTVKLMGEDGMELASMAGPAIDSGATVEVAIPWTPTVSGQYAIYGKVELSSDQIVTNNCSQILNLMINPAGVQAITVGDGLEYGTVPVNTNRRHSLFQTLYYPDELGGIIGEITGIKFYNNFYNNLRNMPISIWLGTTTQTTLAAGYIPSTQLTLVYEGPVTFPAGENTISLVFDESFSYLSGNLVMLVYKSVEDWYVGDDFFRSQIGDIDRSRDISSNPETYNPADPPDGTLTCEFPLTTFMIIPAPVGQISGIVTDVNNQPISGATVTLNDGTYCTTTNDAGQYQFSSVLPATYTLACYAHGYFEHTQSVELEANAELTINVTLQPILQVNVSGTVLANDTGAGLASATIKLRGYESYNATTNAAGAFTIPGVFAGRSYAYNISADGYTSENGQVTIGSTDYDLGEITLSEMAYAPLSVTAEVDDFGTAVLISWLPPDTNALELAESFEAPDFPPDNWAQTITNNAPPNALGIYPTWCRVGDLYIAGNYITPTDGGSQAGLHWDYSHQDEWLITPAFNCPPGAWLSFDSYVFLGSTYGDHYYVKISTDNGSTWTALWDASAQTGGWNEYDSPITLDLSAYGGNQLTLAFHAEGTADNTGLRYYWFIDNVYIGNSIAKVHFTLGDLTIKSAATAQSQTGKPVRTLTGYMVYRLEVGQEQDEAAWTAVTETPITELDVSDTGWADFPDGDYRWAVKALYTNDLSSVASFSNILNKLAPTGMIVGTVRDTNASPIAGATVTNGTVTTTTNYQGAYNITVPVGTHSVTASAAGYDSLTVDDVLVEYDVSTTLNFVLKQTSSDDPQSPVVATALNGNYPNPFNPETAISYSVREPGRVKLDIYNIKGQLVRTLVDEDHATGHYKLVYNAKDNRGRSTASGVYLIRMQAPGYHKTSKIILMQ